MEGLGLQDILDPEDRLHTEDDALLYEDDELDRNACMLPLVRFIEKASSLYSPGDPPILLSPLLGYEAPQGVCAFTLITCAHILTLQLWGASGFVHKLYMAAPILPDPQISAMVDGTCGCKQEAMQNA